MSDKEWDNRNEFGMPIVVDPSMEGWGLVHPAQKVIHWDGPGGRGGSALMLAGGATVETEDQISSEKTADGVNFHARVKVKVSKPKK